MAPSKPCFYFEHPHEEDDGGPPDNSRYKRMEWDCKLGGTLHGFVGYFHSTLYKDVIISTDPATVSVGMFSWFPLYMPLRHPVFIPDGGRVEVRRSPRTRPRASHSSRTSPNVQSVVERVRSAAARTHLYVSCRLLAAFQP